MEIPLSKLFSPRHDQVARVYIWTRQVIYTNYNMTVRFDELTNLHHVLLECINESCHELSTALMDGRHQFAQLSYLLKVLLTLSTDLSSNAICLALAMRKAYSANNTSL